ncbi:methyltransferase [bacterium]|nr:methyltransferase [bacterium]
MTSAERRRRQAILRRILRHHHRPIIKAYVYGRFKIIHLDILERIEAHLPTNGRILDVGCGFGLFDLYFALTSPQREIIRVDINRRRLAVARQAAAGSNCPICVSTTWTYPADSPTSLATPWSHSTSSTTSHPPPPKGCWPLLTPTSPPAASSSPRMWIPPRYQRWFTWWMDKLIDPTTPVHYRHHEEWRRLLENIGFRVELENLRSPALSPTSSSIARSKTACDYDSPSRSC